jgi:hypothetical protein
MQRERIIDTTRSHADQLPRFDVQSLSLFLLLGTLAGASPSVLGCGGGSGKGGDSSAGGRGGSAGAGTGGALATGTGGSAAGGSGGLAATGGTTTAGTGGAGGSSKDAAVDGSADAGAIRGNCPQPAAAPCGGDLVGTWTLEVDACAFQSSSYCPGLTFAVAPTSSYGVVYTFNANGTLSGSIAGRFIATISYPPECLYSDAGAAQSCIDLSNSLQPIVQQLGDAGTNNILTASFNCSPGSRGTCLCDEDVAYTPRVVTGSYTTDATTITIKDLSGPGLPDAGALDGGATSSSGYCVSGNTLTLWSDSASGTARPTVLSR